MVEAKPREVEEELNHLIKDRINANWDVAIKAGDQPDGIQTQILQDVFKIDDHDEIIHAIALVDWAREKKRREMKMEEQITTAETRNERFIPPVRRAIRRNTRS